MTTYVVLAHISFVDNKASADHIYDQAKSVATVASIARIGEAGERTSHCGVYVEQADGSLVPDRRFFLDEFGIVREGEPDPNDPPAWIAPAGAQTAYPLTDIHGNPTRVTHNGRTWQNNTSAENVWEPGAYGWDVV